MRFFGFRLNFALCLIPFFSGLSTGANAGESLNGFGVISAILSQDYGINTHEINVADHSDGVFFSIQKAYAKLVDYEAYETARGRDLLQRINTLLSQIGDYRQAILLPPTPLGRGEGMNGDFPPSPLGREGEGGGGGIASRLYKEAVLNGMAGTILLKRNSYVSGVARMNDSQKAWEKLVDSPYADEANFALGLAEYYKITLFNKSPKNRLRLNAALERMRNAIAAQNETSLYLSLSYIWVLQEQKLFDEAQNLLDRFFEKYPNNTLMLRAAKVIATDREDAAEIKRLSKKLDEISTVRTPPNFSDILSARRALVFASDLEKNGGAACRTAKEAVEFTQTIPAEEQKITWVKRHTEALRRRSAQCK